MSLPRYSSYKNSGVEWLGEVPSHWSSPPLWTLFQRTKRVGHEGEQLLSVYRDFGVIPKASREDNFNKASDDLSTYQLVEPNDLVINKMKAWQGSVAISEHRGIVSPAYFVYRSTHTHNGRYLHYLMRSPQYTAGYLSLSKGIRVNQWDLEPEYHSRMPVLIPSQEEQLAIAQFLDRETGKIDALVAEQERLIALLTEKRQAVISHAVTKGLNPTAPMKPSDIDWLGDIPAHWGVAALKHIANIATGYAFNSDLFVENGVPVIRIGDILLSGSIDIASAKCIVADDLSLYEKYLVQKNDILMAMTGATIGKAGWFDSEQSALLNQRVCYFRAKENAAQRYIWYVLATHFYCEYLRLTAFGGAQPNISDGQLVSCIVCIPTFDEQSAIAEFLDQETSKFDDLIVEAEMAITILQERRTALISAAVTGKIDVRGQARKEKAA